MDFPTLETKRLKLVHIDPQYDQAFFDHVMRMPFPC